MKLRNANTGHGDCPFCGSFGPGTPFGVVSCTAWAKAFLNASDDGSKLDIRSQYRIL